MIKHSKRRKITFLLACFLHIQPFLSAEKYSENRNPQWLNAFLEFDQKVENTFKLIGNTFLGKIIIRGSLILLPPIILMKIIQNIPKSTSQLQTHTIQIVNVTDVTLKDYIGVPEGVQILINQIQHPENYRKLGIPPTKGILLTGNPGTGKSFLARAIAGETKCPFFNISATELEQPFIGMSAVMIRDLFEKAKQAALLSPTKTAIIFIDEIDAIARKRGNFGFGTNVAESALNTLLTEMDGFNTIVKLPSSLTWYEKIMGYEKPAQTQEIAVVILAATNIPDTIDDALKRPGRFDTIIEVENPDVKAREKIISIYLKKYPFENLLTASKLAYVTEGMTPAAIKTIFLEAARRAAFKGNDLIKIDDICYAICAMQQVAINEQRMAETIRILYPFEASVITSDILTFFSDNGGNIKKIIVSIEKIYRKKCKNRTNKKCLISKDDLIIILEKL